MSIKDDNVQLRREIADIALRLNDIRSTAAGVHALVGASHTASGLTPGHFLKATGATTFAFAAHGLTYTDVGAAAVGHNHAGVYEPVITAGTDLQYIRGDKTLGTLNQAAVVGLTTASSPTFAGLNLTGNSSITWATWQLEERYNAFWWWGIYFNEPARSLTIQNQSNDSGGNIYLLPSVAPSVGYVYTGLLRQPIAATAYRLPVATATNIMGELAAGGAAGQYLAGATGAIPLWATLNQAAVAGLTAASSPAFVTVKCSALTDGYIPYHVSDAAGLANGPIRTDGTYVGIGVSPGSLLHAIAANAHIQFRDTGTSFCYITTGNNTTYSRFGNESEAGGDLMVGSLPYATILESVGAYPLQFGTGANARMTILGTGTVLIGATAAVGSELFRCDGNAYFDHDVSALTFTDRP